MVNVCGKKAKYWGWIMAQWVRALVALPESLSLIPRNRTGGNTIL